MRIYLIGFMGSGKSSLGARMARKLNYTFLDLDAEVENTSGLTIPELFDQKGEAYFRELERDALHKTLRHSHVVVATGGGTPCYFNNMVFMKTAGKTVYLKMNPLSLLDRLVNARRRRPLLQDFDQDTLLDYIRNKLAEREASYLQADCIIKGESVKPGQVIILVFGE
ncbi:MAG: shikimate kinase [Bacteroidales bacterium]